EEPLPGRSSYFRGSDPAAWVTDVSNYGRVVYHQVYPGIDLAYHGDASGGRDLEYDFLLAPGADPALIRLQVQGADSLRLDQQGRLVLATAGGSLVEHAPTLYQDRPGGGRGLVSGGYVLLGPDTVGFQVGAHDPALPLVIDPTVGYATYLGGSN